MMKKTVSIFLTMALALMGLVSCGKEEEKQIEKHVYESVVGEKYFSISYSPEKAEGGEYSAEEMTAIDKNAEAALVSQLSFLSSEHNGDIGNINAMANYVFDYDKDVASLMKKLYEISEATGGAYKPVVVSTTEEYSCSAFIEITDEKLIKHDRNAKVDLMGISESYALSFAMENLKAAGLKEAILKYGNTVARIDERDEKSPVNVALYYADGNADADAKLKLHSGYITTSTKDEQITDPVTGNALSARHNTVAVISDDAFVSSCLARAFMIMDTDDIFALQSSGKYSFEVVIVESDMSVTSTNGVSEKGLMEVETEAAE